MMSYLLIDGLNGAAGTEKIGVTVGWNELVRGVDLFQGGW